MAIPIPVTKTRIATVPWGIPITNEVNRLTTFTTPTAWTNLTMQNGWVAYNAAYAPQYRKVGDNVQIRGLMQSGPTTVVCFTLPAGFRPNREETFVIVAGGGNPTFASISIGTNGAATVVTSLGIAYLSNIIFSTIA